MVTPVCEGWGLKRVRVFPVKGVVDADLSVSI